MDATPTTTRDARADTAPALFDGFTVRDMREHAAAHPSGSPTAAPQVLDLAGAGAFIVVIHGMPVGQIQWQVEQDANVFSDDDAVALAAVGDDYGYYAEVSSLVVDPAFQRRGIGTLLLDRFIEFATAQFGEKGWAPGKFTAEGAAFFKAVRGHEVVATRRIAYFPGRA